MCPDISRRLLKSRKVKRLMKEVEEKLKQRLKEGGQ